MRAVDILRKKRDGRPLTRPEVEAFVAGATRHTWPDYQLAALLMAIVLRGMDEEETAWLTAAMAHSGVRLDLSDLPGPKVDKHSTGGVGDKTSLILAPLAASCGVVVPMMSGRGLAHTGGTLDKLESIPGFRVGLSLDEFRAALRQVGCALIGQTAEIAPADRTLYALRDVTATVESVPLITASIMSKKIAEGINALVMDVKCGRGAFMPTHLEARRLAQALVRTGNANGVRTEALITGMDAPLGRAVGNSLEVVECLETLKGRGPKDLEDLSVTLAGRMLLLAGVADNAESAEAKIRQALASGRGLEKFQEILEQQGGDPRSVEDYGRLPTAPRQAEVRATRPGYVQDARADLLGAASMILGAGREKVEDAVDHAVGIVLHAKPGDEVRAGDLLAVLHYRDAGRLGEALAQTRRAFELGDALPYVQPLVRELVVESNR